MEENLLYSFVSMEIQWSLISSHLSHLSGLTIIGWFAFALLLRVQTAEANQ
jgi:hypothetical protein